jgi:hypothetical protein
LVGEATRVALLIFSVSSSLHYGALIYTSCVVCKVPFSDFGLDFIFLKS